MNSQCSVCLYEIEKSSKHFSCSSLIRKHDICVDCFVHYLSQINASKISSQGQIDCCGDGCKGHWVIQKNVLPRQIQKELDIKVSQGLKYHQQKAKSKSNFDPKEIEQHVNNIIENCCTPICPRCNVRFGFNDQTCLALTCESCQVNFCGLCGHMDSSSSASHQHIRDDCFMNKFNTLGKNILYCSVAFFNECQSKQYAPRIIGYLASILDPVKRQVIQERVQHVLHPHQQMSSFDVVPMVPNQEVLPAQVPEAPVLRYPQIPLYDHLVNVRNQVDPLAFIHPPGSPDDNMQDDYVHEDILKEVFSRYVETITCKGSLAPPIQFEWYGNKNMHIDFRCLKRHVETIVIQTNPENKSAKIPTILKYIKENYKTQKIKKWRHWGNRSYIAYAPVFARECSIQ